MNKNRNLTRTRTRTHHRLLMSIIISLVIVLYCCMCFAATSSNARLPAPAVKSVVTKDGLITLTFKDTDIKDIFTGISMVTGVSIVADASVQGRIAFLSLRNVPLDEAIQAVAAAGGLQHHRSGNVYAIGRNLNVKSVSASYRNHLLTLEATRADVKELLQAVGQASGVNFIPSQDIQKFITISLKDVALEPAMLALLEENGLEMIKKNDQLYTVRLKPQTPPAPRTVGPRNPPSDSRQQPAPSHPALPVRRSDKVTLTLDNAAIGEIITKICDQTGAAMILTTQFDDKVRRSVRLSGVSVEDALAAVLAGTKYTYIRLDSANGKSQKTQPPASPPSEKKNESSSNSDKGPLTLPPLPLTGGEGWGEGGAPPRFMIGEVTSLSAPEALPFLFTEIVPLKHLRAAEASAFFSARILKEALRPLKDQNSLSITGTQEQIDRIKEELRSLDVPAAQIMIQAIVVETTLTTLKDLGIEYLAQENRIQVQGPTGSTFIFRTTGGFGRQFMATLTALITQGKAKVLANPRIATISGKEANIDITDTRYFRTAGFPLGQVPTSGTTLGGGAPPISTGFISPFAFGTIQSIDAGIKLKITPWVGAEGDIQVDVSPEVSSVTGTGPEGLPELSKRVATTSVRVKNGDSIMIGGLRQKNESKSVTKPFLLGDIPLIGNLFRHTVKNQRESDLFILITPRLIEGESIEQIEKQLPPDLSKMVPESLDLRRKSHRK